VIRRRWCRGGRVGRARSEYENDKRPDDNREIAHGRSAYRSHTSLGRRLPRGTATVRVNVRPSSDAYVHELPVVVPVVYTPAPIIGNPSISWKSTKGWSRPALSA
jgi:hypothetical protein